MHRRTLLKSGVALALAGALPRPLRAATDTAPPDLMAVRGDRTPVALAGSALRNLKASLRGNLLLAADPGYDTARHVLNGAIDRCPALIVQPTGAADVRTAVAFARSLDLLVAVKCGGHSFSGQSTCDGGLQLDLSLLRGVRVDARARRAWVEGGTLLGAVDHEGMREGFVTPLGTVSHTGAGGLTTGGGFGRLARRFGLALDNVTVVDIHGRRHAASRERGRKFRSPLGSARRRRQFRRRDRVRVRAASGGSLVFPIERARDVLQRYAECSVSAPDELHIDCFVSYPAAGRTPVCGFDACWSGAAPDAGRVLAPLRAPGTPLRDGIRAIDYVALQRLYDSTDPRGIGNYTKSGFTTTIADATIDAIMRGLAGDPKRGTIVYFQHAGGAIARVDPQATAFPFRYAQQNMMVFASWKAGDDSAAPIAWAREYWKTLEPATRGFYINEAGGDEGARALNANYLDNYPRLAQIKRRYDPSNLFRLNANITPTA